MKPALQVAAWAGVLSVLALVFTAYLGPHLVVDLASRIWACF
jgi:hypothetical protein